MFHIIRESGYLAIFLLFILVAYWQLGAGDGILRWDGPHCFLAWRYNVTELIRAGQLPLWSTWQHLGFPLYADPETGAWYPIVWLMAPFRGYDFYSLHGEWLLHVFIAATGMHALLRSMGVQPVFAIAAGICFSGCGVFVSNAQNFGFLIGLAWSPWVLHFFRQIFKTWSYAAAAKFALVFWMMFTGSYPAITFMLVYSLLIAAVFFIVKQKIFRVLKGNLGRIKILLTTCVLTLGLAMVHLVSIVEILPEMTRSSGLSVEKLLENSFTPQALISFVTPFAVGTNQSGFWQSDFSMINAYAGLLTAVLFLTWIFSSHKTRSEWAMIIGFGMLMIAAMGQTFPLRLWLAEWPGLGVFRHPSIFRFLAVMILIVFAFSFMQRLINQRLYRPFMFSSLILGLILVVLILWNAVDLKSDPGDVWSYWSEWKGQEVISVSDRIFYHAIVQLIFLGGFVWCIRKTLKTGIVVLCFLEMVLAVQLNVHETVVYPHSFDEAQTRLEFIEEHRGSYQGGIIADIHSENDTLGIKVLIENEHIFLHRPAYDGYNSFILRGYNQLEHDSLHRNKLSKPLIYCENGDEVRCIAIHGNQVKAEINCSGVTGCILLQNHLPGWTCLMDGVPVEVTEYDHTFSRVEIQPGLHRLEFRYTSIAATYALCITIIALLSAVLIIIVAYHKNRGSLG